MLNLGISGSPEIHLPILVGFIGVKRLGDSYPGLGNRFDLPFTVAGPHWIFTKFPS